MVATPASVLRLAVLVGAIVISQAATLFASPFEGGTLSWERDMTLVSTTDVRFIVKIDLTLDRNGTVFSPLQPVAGQDVSSGRFRFTLIDKTNLQFLTVPFTLTVTSVEATEQWFTATRTMLITVPITRLPVRVRMNESARPSTLRDGNSSAFFRLETTLPAPGGPTVSPRFVAPARLYWLQNQAALVQLSAQNLGGAPTTFTLSTALQSALTQIRPAGTMQVSTAGLVSWQPDVVGLYAVQFRVNTFDAAGVLQASVPYDVIVNVVSSCRSFVIGCNTAPTFSPSVPQALTARVGELLQLTVAADDSDYGDEVSMSSAGLGDGMTFELQSQSNGHAEYLLSWTPTRVDLLPLGAPQQHVVCFQAQDSRGAMTGGNDCLTVTLDPSSGTPPSVTCPVPFSVRGGSLAMARVVLDADVEGASGRAMTVSWVYNGNTLFSAAVSGVDTHRWSTAQDLGVGTHAFEARAAFANGAVACTTSVTVTPRSTQQISVTPVGPTREDSPPVTLLATASSGLPVRFALVNGPATLAGNLLTPLGPGTVDLLALQDGDEDWFPAPPVPFSVVVNAAPPPPPPPGPQFAPCNVSLHQVGNGLAPVGVRLQVCDQTGRNVSSRALVVTAVALVDEQGVRHQVRSLLPTGTDTRFVFEPLGDSYVLAVRFAGLQRGTYDLLLTIGDTPASVKIATAANPQAFKNEK